VSADPTLSRSVTTMAFDRLAAQYDSLNSGDIFRRLRARTHRVFARCVAAESRVLEIGCGVGIDTCFLAARGARIVACDPSEEMVSRALKRLAAQGVDAQATVIPAGVDELECYLDALGLSQPFDAIVSNFGALNCVPHLASLSAIVRRHLRPNGVVLLGLMSRLCVMEAAYFTWRRTPHLIRRRVAAPVVCVSVAGFEVPTYYHRIGDVCDALAPEVSLTAVEGIGVAIPPPYLEARWQQLPPAVRKTMAAIDACLAPWPPFNRLGDHVLLHFTRGDARG
jgi:ubiquinone/menaquinone biosynthesis C-methylase UbiE